ncbi:MAG: hypothetical protein EHM28_02890 [Spirochaetaceae bacterium]|nr:MAG: hypothetical protein EHM28_02890 [Spirochaetaceae bacterium]
MKRNQFISIRDLSALCKIEITVLKEWAECGLISVRIQGKIEGIASDELREIRRIVGLYKDLGVNNEGIEIIIAMRNRILEMSGELASLHNKLEQLEKDHRFRYLEIPRENGLILDYYENRE